MKRKSTCWVQIGALFMFLTMAAPPNLLGAETEDKVGKRLAEFLGIPEDHPDSAHFTFKAWPSYSGRYITVNYPDPDSLKSDTLPIHIDVIDVRNGKFVRVASGTYPFVIDFTSLPQISLDTARYEFKAGLIAFGLNLYGSTSRAGGGVASTDRILMVVDGAALKDVAGPFTVASEYGEPADGCEDCLARTVTQSVISISDQITNGYHDILYRHTSRSWIDGKGKPDAKSAPESVTNQVYRWDGNRYRKAGP